MQSSLKVTNDGKARETRTGVLLTCSRDASRFTWRENQKRAFPGALKVAMLDV